ncbi:MAG: regulatory protein GemA [Deltaproteobacteria bacterium]|nr:regulatory protein GemA [Deltaproteobacteria bacterium]
MKPHSRIKPPQVQLLNVALSELNKMGVAISRDEVKARFGVASTKELTCAQFDEAMRHFEACGFVYRPKVGKAPKIAAQARIKQRFLLAIEKLLNDLDKDWPYAEGIAARMNYPRKLEWCTPEQLHKVQIALAYAWREAQGLPVQRRPETLRRRAARAKHV